MSRTHVRKWRFFLALVSPIAMAVACGCSSGGGGAKPPAQKTMRLTPVEYRALAMGAADNYSTAVAAAADQLRKTTKRPEVADWAWQTKIATALASFTNATGPNDTVCLLDMVLFATLKRHALEEHWIPDLLHEEGAPVLEVYRRAEADVWEAAARALTPQQQANLRSLIDQWLREHPRQFYVSHVRFTDMAAAMKVTPSSPQAQGTDSVFGLLRLDPLAGLDPVTKELRNYRALTERMMYMSVRMPLVLGWQVEYVTTRATATPEIQRAVGTAERFAATLEKYPAELSKERQAALVQAGELLKAERKEAIDQLSRSVTAEREAVSRDVTAQQSAVRQIIGDVQRVVETAAKATETANAETSKTIMTTDAAGRRAMVLGFRLVLAVILVILLGVPTVLLLYRLAAKRWVGPAARRPRGDAETRTTFVDWQLNPAGPVYGVIEDGDGFAGTFKDFPPRAIPTGIGPATITDETIRDIREARSRTADAGDSRT